METKCPAIYINIFWEYLNIYIYHLIKEKCKLYLSYINDLFLIWTRNLDKLHKFIAKINQVYPLIKFDFIIQATVEIS